MKCDVKIRTALELRGARVARMWVYAGQERAHRKDAADETHVSTPFERQRRRDGEVPAATVAREDDAVTVNPEVGGAGVHVPDRADAVVDPAWELCRLAADQAGDHCRYAQRTLGHDWRS